MNVVDYVCNLLPNKPLYISIDRLQSEFFTLSIAFTSAWKVIYVKVAATYYPITTFDIPVYTLQGYEPKLVQKELSGTGPESPK